MIGIPNNHYIKRKVRGQKRKLNRLKQRLNDKSNFFPDDSYVQPDKYYHIHMPCSQGFVDSKNSPSNLRKECIQLLINTAYDLTKTRPDSKKENKIVCAVTLPFIWDSQIIVFFDNYYDQFFDNINSYYEGWSKLNSELSIIDSLNLKCPDTFSVQGYSEEINYGNYIHKGQTWFIGEL
tara:strand:- start:963 stop:1499 length:537 start_codon:yes stop_codon:yes gene_type:complete